MSFSLIAKAALALLPAAAQVAAQTYSNTYGVYTITQDTGGNIPLASKHFSWPDLPYQADTGNGPRGTQQGYNLCNSTTEGANSWCQTAYINSIDDFCIWGSPTSNQTVGAVEEEMVAYCTKKGHGGRLLPAGALQGVTFVSTPGYVQVTGMVDQTALNLQADDGGGEEDPHGADQRGNPLGSLLYSSAFTNKTNQGKNSYTQVIEWSYFVGSGTFCFKACDPSDPQAPELCQHIYDRVGCNYNAPMDYAHMNGTFQSCKGDNQLPAGVYVTNGVTSTWAQPAESLGAISTIPYTASVPASSSCTTYTSTSIYTDLVSTTASVAASGAGATAGYSAQGTRGGSGSGSAQATGQSSSNGKSSGASRSIGGDFLVGAGFFTAAAVFGAVAVLA